MSNNPRKPNMPDEDSTIFRRHKSGDAIRQEEKQEKRRQRQELTRELTTVSPETRTVTTVMIILLVVIVAGCALAVVWGNRDSGKEKAPDSEWFQRLDALPELSQEGIKAELIEAYYTVDGSFMAKLQLGNGLPTPQTVTEFELTIDNADGEELAVGHQAADWDPQSLEVPANGYTELTVYIPQKDVKIAGDPLDTLTLHCTITAKPEDQSVLDTTTTTATAK